MMYWDTGDRVVDCLLQKMDGLSGWRTDSDPEQTHQLIVALINIQEMLPKAVARHFSLPHLFVGNAHFERGDDYRTGLIADITEALRNGLASANADPLLQRDGGADLSDRPRSRGEEILEAAKAFQAHQDSSSLMRLKMAVSPTALRGRLKTIEMLMTRKRSYGNQEPRVAMLGELNRLQYEAEGYHGHKA